LGESARTRRPAQCSLLFSSSCSFPATRILSCPLHAELGWVAATGVRSEGRGPLPGQGRAVYGMADLLCTRYNQANKQRACSRTPPPRSDQIRTGRLVETGESGLVLSRAIDGWSEHRAGGGGVKPQGGPFCRWTAFRPHKLRSSTNGGSSNAHVEVLGKPWTGPQRLRFSDAAGFPEWQSSLTMLS
jgi:hypothetical protein